MQESASSRAESCPNLNDQFEGGGVQDVGYKGLGGIIIQPALFDTAVEVTKQWVARSLTFGARLV